MKNICIDCKNCILEGCAEGFFSTAKCRKYPFIKDYVGGETDYEECASINVDGKCSFYAPTTSKKIKIFLSNIFNN